jgi:hypothetical protein
VIDKPNDSTIVVTIGQRTRLYRCFVTSAPSRLDAPGTVTLYASTISDIAVFAVDETVLEASRAGECARLVLIDAAELPWQRARCREERHLLAAADGGVAGDRTLQSWLWRLLCQCAYGAP